MTVHKLLLEVRTIARGSAMVFICLLALSACGSAPAEPAASPVTTAPPTVPDPVIRRTLPPTWTPTLTPSALPTATLTRTATPSPTLSAETICAGLTADISIDPGVTYDYYDTFSLLIALAAPNARIDVQFIGVDSGETRGFEIPGGPGGAGGSFLLTFDRLLAGAGRYDWTLAVITEQYGSICTRGGSFIIRPPSPLRGEFGRLATWVATDYAPFTLTPTPSPTPTQTATPTSSAAPESTAETTAQQADS